MLNIEKITEGDYKLLNIVGEIDASSSLELDQALSETLDNPIKKLLINCTSLDYISSAGLGVFMSYIEEFKKNQVQAVFYGLNDKVNNVFEILGLHRLLCIKKDKEEAKADLQ